MINYQTTTKFQIILIRTSRLQLLGGNAHFALSCIQQSNWNGLLFVHLKLILKPFMSSIANYLHFLSCHVLYFSDRNTTTETNNVHRYLILGQDSKYKILIFDSCPRYWMYTDIWFLPKIFNTYLQNHKDDRICLVKVVTGLWFYSYVMSIVLKISLT